MPLQIHALQKQAEAYFAAKGEGALDLPLDPRRFPLLFRPDSYCALAELEKSESHAKWRTFLAERVLEAAAAEARSQHRTLFRKGEVHTPEEMFPLWRARALRQMEPFRLRRAQLDHAVADLLVSHQEIWVQWAENNLQAASKLGAPNPLVLLTQDAGWDPGRAQDDATSWLYSTEDAYRDLWAYALKKVEPTLRPLPFGDAHAHDLLHALTAPWLSGFFPPDALAPALAASAAELGFADGPVELWERGGLSSYRSALSAQGRALHQTSMAERVSFEGRHLGDQAVVRAQEALHRLLLTDVGWLKRYLHLPTAAARECARIAAFVELASLRWACVRSRGEQLLMERGSVREAMEVSRTQMAERLYAGEATGLCLLDLKPSLNHLTTVRGFLLGAALGEHLRRNFNEDYWRNPAAGAFLRELSATGQAGTADQQRQRLEQKMPGWRAVNHLVSILNR